MVAWARRLAALVVGVARADGARLPLIGVAVRREWHEERFSALYLDETLRGHKEVSVLFADLAGFTPFTEAHGSADVHAMLVAYFGRLAPMIRDEFDGEVAEFVGDQIFVVFNKAGDQPDHAVAAARAGSRSSGRRPRSRHDHPDWPRFRAGVNSGEVLAGVVGDRGHRIHGVFGDTVNLGSRSRAESPVGQVVLRRRDGAATASRCGR